MKLLTTTDFGAIVRITRKQSKLTQAQLAAASGIGERFVRELEKGKATCQLEKALLVLHMLGIKLEATPPHINE